MRVTERLVAPTAQETSNLACLVAVVDMWVTRHVTERLATGRAGVTLSVFQLYVLGLSEPEPFGYMSDPLGSRVAIPTRSLVVSLTVCVAPGS